MHQKNLLLKGLLVWFMVFNATFNNITVISWQSDLLVEESGVNPEKTTDLSQVTDKLHYLKILSNIYIA